MFKLPQNSRAYILKSDNFAVSYNQGIFEAMLKSVSRPEILDSLLKAFPEYMGHPEGECGILQVALKHNELESVTLLLPLICDLYYHLNKAGVCYPYHTHYNSTKLVFALSSHCLNWTSKHNDIAVLHQLFEVLNCVKFAKILMYRKVLYFLLYLSCCQGTVQSTKYLVEAGLDVYENCNATCNALIFYKKLFSTDFRERITLVAYHHRYHSSWNRQVSPLFLAAVNSNIDLLKYLLTLVDPKKFYQLELFSPISFLLTRSMSEPLYLLFEAGFKLVEILNAYDYDDNKMVFDLNALLGYDETNMSTNMLKVLIKFGALELVLAFNTAGSSTNSLRKLLKKLWHQNANLLEDYKYFNIEKQEVLFVKKFSIFLHHIELFRITFPIADDENAFLEPIIPSL